MVLAPHELPSDGIDLSSDTLSFTPLTFSELLVYTRDYEKAKSEIDKYLVDIEMIKSKVRNWESINLIDLDFVIYTIKRISVSMTASFSTEKTCKCGCVNTFYLEINQVQKAKVLRTDIRGSIFIGNRTLIFEAPKLTSFIEVIEKIHRYKKTPELKLIKLISMFPEFTTNPNIIESLILNATNDDVIRLLTLDQMFLDSKIEIPRTCKECKEGGMSVSINNLIDNVFLSLLLSGDTVETKIIIG